MPTFEDAIQKLQRGQLKEGQRILETLLERDPANPDLLFNLGICYSEQGALGKSIKVLKKCVAVAPDSDLALVNRWAETVDISDWFYWRDFEDMPESYYHD